MSSLMCGNCSSGDALSFGSACTSIDDSFIAKSIVSSVGERDTEREREERQESNETKAKLRTSPLHLEKVQRHDCVDDILHEHRAFLQVVVEVCTVASS